MVMAVAYALNEWWTGERAEWVYKITTNTHTGTTQVQTGKPTHKTGHVRRQRRLKRHRPPPPPPTTTKDRRGSWIKNARECKHTAKTQHTTAAVVMQSSSRILAGSLYTLGGTWRWTTLTSWEISPLLGTALAVTAFHARHWALYSPYTAGNHPSSLRNPSCRLWRHSLVIIGDIIRGISDNAGAARLNWVSIRVPPIRVRVLYTCFKIRTKQCELVTWTKLRKHFTAEGRLSVGCSLLGGFSGARRRSVLVLETAFTRGGLSRHHKGRNMVMFRG